MEYWDIPKQIIEWQRRNKLFLKNLYQETVLILSKQIIQRILFNMPLWQHINFLTDVGQFLIPKSYMIYFIYCFLTSLNCRMDVKFDWQIVLNCNTFRINQIWSRYRLKSVLDVSSNYLRKKPKLKDLHHLQ